LVLSLPCFLVLPASFSALKPPGLPLNRSSLNRPLQLKLLPLTLHRLHRLHRTSSHCNMANSNGGIGLGGLLTVLFVGLKLGHVIDWSWWWVLSPLWIGAALFLVFALICLVFAIFASATGAVVARRFLKGFRSE
jgi:hypothetical protein